MTTTRRWLPEGFFRPVEYAKPSTYRRPPAFYRHLQSIAPWILRLGLAPSYVVQLDVAGRRTGVPRRSLMVQVTHDGADYLVSLAGESEWVRNVRAAGGDVLVTAHRRRRAAHLVEVPSGQRPDIIRAYVNRPGSRGRAVARTSEARHYFGIDPDASLAQIAQVADRYPVFRVDRRAGTPSR